MNNILKNTKRIYNNSDGYLTATIAVLQNNVYKITYYEIISGASGTLTVSTGATINAGEFSGADCVLSEIDGSNKPTFVTPLTGGGSPVTATLNTSTGAWLKSGVTASTNVALIYSVNITAADYQNLTNFYIIDNVLISNFSQVLNSSALNSTTSSQLAGVISDETGTGALVFGTSPTFTTDITTPLIVGGSAVGSVITYKTTTGIGTAALGHTFVGGTNGNLTLATLANNGNTTFGNSQSFIVGLVSSSSTYTFLNTASTTAMTALASTSSTLKTQSSANSISLVSFSGDVNYINAAGQGLYITTVATKDIFLRPGGAGSNVVTFSNSSTTFTPTTVATGAITNFTLTSSANTNQTIGTNIPNFRVTGNNKQWATGALATQYFNYFTDNTISFVGASTATNSYNTYIESVVAGTNATLTRKYSLGTSDNVAFGIANSTATLHLGVAPSASNYMLSNAAGAGSTYLNAPTGGFVVVSIGGANRFQVNNSSITFNPSTATATNVTTCYAFSFSSNTNQTLSTEIPGVVYNNYSRNWATGNITTQREQYIKTATYTAIGASVITNAYGFYVEAPTASTNITITNNYALGLAGSLKINDTFNIVFDTTTGTKIATATTQKLAFWNATPIVQPTTAVAAATVVSGTGGNVKHDDTFDGYTLEKIVRALRTIGLLA